MFAAEYRFILFAHRSCSGSFVSFFSSRCRVHVRFFTFVSDSKEDVARHAVAVTRKELVTLG